MGRDRSELRYALEGVERERALGFSRMTTPTDADELVRRHNTYYVSRTCPIRVLLVSHRDGAQRDV